MKRMKKFFAVALLAMGVSSLAQAQQVDAGVHILGFGSPMGGNFGEVYNGGYSWNIFGMYQLSDEITAGVEIGSTSFSYSGPTFFGMDLSISLTELHAVGMYRLVDGDVFSLLGGLGAGFYTGDGAAEIGVSPRISAQYMITDNIGLSAQLPVHLVLTESEFNYFTIRFGGFYRFEL